MAAPSFDRGCRWPGSGRAEALVCSDGERAWRGRARPSGERRAGRRGGPGRWRGTSRGAGVLEPDLPAGRRYVEAPSAWTGEGKENKNLRPFVSWEGNGEAAVSPSGIYGEGGLLGGDGWEGGRLPAWRTKSRALGRRGRPPLLPAEACPQRLRGEVVGSTSLTQPGWEESSALLFPGRGKWGGGSCCHVVAPVFRLLSASHSTPMSLPHLPGMPSVRGS